MSNVSVNLAGVQLKNPVMTASGTFGSGQEYSEFVDLNKLGAVVTKGVANVPWPGNPTPRIAETTGGMLNAIGLQNPGIDVFCERDIPFLKKYDTRIIVNVCGKSTEDYCEVVERLGNEPVDMLEINVSCPNVKEGGIAFGQNPKALEAITKVMARVTGSYALGILFQDHPGKVFAVRKDSPMIVGSAPQGNFIASDVPAILKYTKNVYFVNNMEIVCMDADSIHFYNVDQEEIEKEITTINWDAEAAEKGGYEHFMLKEIYEQPKAVQDTISPRIKDGEIVLEELEMSEEEIRRIRRIYMIGCGSAYHVCVSARYVLEALTRIPVEVDLASEFRYRDPILEEDSLVIVISQSGETADTIAALKEAKSRGARVLGIVNVVGSSIAREADNVLYTWAGPEISVATTKAYSTQLAACYLISIYFAKIRQTINEEKYHALVAELKKLPEKIQRILGDKERVQWFANKFASSKDIFFIGRGLDYGISLEGSLKLKEISYIHSEAYAAGELKHGTISLIEKGILVIGIATQPDLYEKMISNMVEVKSRGAYLMGLTCYGNYSMEDTANFTVYVPKTEKYFTNSLAVIPLQLFAYYVAIARGLDVDKPRNLAKSVTVE